MRPSLVESSMRVSCFDVVPLMRCDSGSHKRIGFSDVFFTKGARHCGLHKKLHQRDMFGVKRGVRENTFARCVDHVESSCEICCMCSYDSIACLLSRFDVLLSVFFLHRLLLYFHVCSWECRDVTLVADAFCSQTGFFWSWMKCDLFLLASVLRARCATRSRIQRHWR